MIDVIGQMEQLAQEAQIKHQLEKLGIPYSDKQKDVMVKFNYHLQKIMGNDLKRIENPLTQMDEVIELMKKSGIEAFDVTANEFREKKMWEEYGILRWIQGASGVPMEEA